MKKILYKDLIIFINIMIYDQPEHFGINEKPITAKEKEEVKQFLKYDRHVPLKLTE